MQLLAILFFYSCKTNKPNQKIQEFTLQKIGAFPTVLQECSGMVVYKDKLITLNDSGNTPELHFIDPQTAQLVHSQKIENVKNIDWEALLLHEDQLYIGNFGNNKGARKDLIIYMLSLNSMTDIELKDAYPFNYEDQFDFNVGKKHNFDCESLIMINDTLTLFSKNRKNKRTNIYKLKKRENIAVKKQGYNVPVRVTDACYVESEHKIFLLCNAVEKGTEKVFLKSLIVDKNNKIKDGQIWTLDMREQAEAICFDGKSFYIGTEKETTYGGHLFKLTFNK